MNQNKFRTPPQQAPKPKPEGKKVNKAVEGWLSKFDFMSVEGVKRIMFMFILALIYIANSHLTNKTIIKISKLKNEVDELVVDYTTLKAKFMYHTKQSEIAKRVEGLGLYESRRPPKRIEIDKDELYQDK